MDTGTIVTVILTLLLTVAFWASVKRVVRKFADGQCGGGCSACGGCGVREKTLKDTARR